MAISLTYTFVAGTRAQAAQVNSNFSTLATRALDKTGDTMTGNLLFTDATYDIGASGATRPRDLFLSRNATIGGTLAVTGTTTLTGAVVSNLIFTDNTYDIGASGATRPRHLYLAGNITIGGNIVGTIPLASDGRLTLTTDLPVTTADVSGATTLYYTPHIGNRISLFTGSVWVLTTFSQMSIAAASFPNSSRPHDVFMDYNDGTPQLTCEAWTNDTTRATALVKQNGVWVKTGDTQQRYLGTIYLDSSNQFNDTLAKRHVWNAYNRVARPLRVLETTDTPWVYTTATWRQARATATNQLEVIVGLAEDALDMSVQVMTTQDTVNIARYVAIGESSTTTPSTLCIRGEALHNLTSFSANLSATLTLIPAVGYRYYPWLEYSVATGNTTWYGDNGALLIQSGMRGMWRA